MKTFALVLMMMNLLLHRHAFALESVKYYAGTSVLSEASTGVQYSNEKVFVQRTVSPANKMIIEIACVRTPEGKYRQSPAYMAINGNRVVATDNPDMKPSLFEGTGFVSGTPWNWEYLFLDLKTNFGGRIFWITDVNIVTDLEIHALKILYPNIGTFDKPVRAPEPSMLMTVKARQIDREQYLKEIANLGCSPL